MARASRPERYPGRSASAVRAACARSTKPSCVSGGTTKRLSTSMRAAYAAPGGDMVAPSENLLRRLARVSPTTAFLAALALMLAGLFLPGIVGAALLFVLGTGLAALTVTTWPVQPPSTRALRVLMLVLLLAAVVAKAM